MASQKRKRSHQETSEEKKSRKRADFFYSRKSLINLDRFLHMNTSQVSQSAIKSFLKLEDDKTLQARVLVAYMVNLQNYKCE